MLARQWSGETLTTGCYPSYTFYGDTWEWNGSTWTQRSSSGPSGRYDHAMAYDAARGVIVLFGGGIYTNGYNIYYGDTWEWNGSTWTQRSTSGPSPRSGHAMAYDAARHVTVLFGGYTTTYPSYNRETWEWNGSTWTQRSSSGPSARNYHAMAYDAARGVTVLFGGYDASGYNGQTWEWNGSTWTQRSSSGPSPRNYHAMAYDAARGVTVLFGGYNAGTYYGDTWEWNGSTWTQRSSSGPSGRYDHAMAYDAAQGVTMLFGGYYYDGYNHFVADTWEWNGSTWTQRSSSGPSPREAHAMAYDAARGVTVLFGGFGYYGTYYGDTWEWNGGAWTQRSSSGPSPRASHAMAYDAARGVTVLFGGAASGSNGDTWEFGLPRISAYRVSPPVLIPPELEFPDP